MSARPSVRRFALERQYVFFHTGPALLLFSGGFVLAFCICVDVMPQGRWARVAVIAVASVCIILGSFGLDNWLVRTRKGRPR